jgi:hypothetical protein
MKNRQELYSLSLFPGASMIKALVTIVLMVMLASCATQGAQESAAQEADRVPAEQEAARTAEQQEWAAELQRKKEQQETERARLQAEKEQQLAEAKARAEAERQDREAAERRERAHLAAIAAAEAERQQKVDRIAALEQQIASIQSQVLEDEARRDVLEQAIVIAEELLAALTDEQAKYEETDSEGNTIRPLAKEHIAELEARKNELLGQAHQ